MKICWDFIANQQGFPEPKAADPQVRSKCLEDISKQIKARQWAIPKTGGGRGGNQKNPLKDKLPCVIQALQEAADKGVSHHDIHQILQAAGAFMTSHTKKKFFGTTGAEAAEALRSMGGAGGFSAFSAAPVPKATAAESLTALLMGAAAATARVPTPMSAAESLAALLMGQADEEMAGADV